jgi:uncharacterized membrane protein YeiH
MSFQVSLWIELLAAGLGGLQGTLFAAGERRHRIDVLGVVVIGLAVSLGGSLLRNIVLDQPPVVVWKNWYLPVAGASAVLGMLLQPILARADRWITALDAVVMGLFGAIGASPRRRLGRDPRRLPGTSRRRLHRHRPAGTGRLPPRARHPLRSEHATAEL